MKILQKKVANNKQDSFWYGGIIATNGKYSLYALGEIKAITKDGEVLNEYQALEYAEEHHLTDKNLYTELEFIMNNWFEIVADDDGGNGIVYDNYDEAIKGLKEIKE